MTDAKTKSWTIWLDGDDAGDSDGASQGDNTDNSTNIAKQLEQERNRSAGLDRRISQLQQQLNQLTEERNQYEEQLETAQTNVGEVSTQFEELQTRAQEQAAQLAEFQERAEAASAKAQRAEIVATQFPQLAPLLEAGGLPQFDGEQETYTERLAGIVEALNLNQAPVKQSADDAGQGKPPASPGASGTPGSQDVDALWNDYMAAVKDGSDPDLINELKEQYYAALD